MALIACPECKQQISNNAPVCPHCGYTLKATTIEQTDKTWKLLKLMALLMFVVGLFLIPRASAWMLITFGIIFFIAGKIGAWWNNR